MNHVIHKFQFQKNLRMNTASLTSLVLFRRLYEPQGSDIRHVSLINIGLKDDHVPQLCQLMHSAPLIESISLANNEMTCLGVKAIAGQSISIHYPL